VTARHVIEDARGWQPLAVMAPGFGVGSFDQSDVGAEAYFAPHREEKDLDVAVVTLRPALYERFRDIAAGIESIPEDDRIEESDVVSLAGFPTFLGFRPKTMPRTYLAATLTHLTGVKGRDRFEGSKSTGARRFPMRTARPFRTWTSRRERRRSSGVREASAAVASGALPQLGAKHSGRCHRAPGWSECRQLGTRRTRSTRKA